MKKAIFLSIILLLLLFQGAQASQQGLMPCSGLDCDLGDVIQTFRNIIHLLLRRIIPPLAALMLIVGGAFWVLSGGSEENIALGKKIIFATIIGIILAYGAEAIINTILDAIGYVRP